MGISKNTKVNRLLEAMAVILHDNSDITIKELHAVINDERDGYNFDFIAACNSYRNLLVK